MTFEATDKNLFFSKNDLHDQRLGDFAQVYSHSGSKENAFVVLGYPDDEGIKLNGGRPGAALGPDQIRKFLYKMTPTSTVSHPKIFDYGNISTRSSLEDRHKEAHTAVKDLLDKSFRVIALGGGHDYGFSDFSAFCDWSLAKNRRPAVINFDAHLDVRPDDKGENSGTPFYRLLKKYSKDIDFFEVGIQDWCNSPHHLNWAREKGATVISLGEIMSCGRDLSDFLSENILAKLGRNCDLALSLDIDGITSSAGPGASQVFPVGLDPASLLKFWTITVARFKPALAGIYEVSPPLDLDDRTSKLAAIFAHQFIFSETK